MRRVRQPKVWPAIEEELRTRDRSTGCWLRVPAPTNDCRYPIAWRDGGVIRLNRAVLESELGRPIGPGLMALHTCDIPECYNPTHLYEGTRDDNAEDCRRRDRQAKGDRHPSTKITDADAIAIFSDPRASALVAEEYGISPAMVRMIRSGRRKAWLTSTLLIEPTP